MRKDSVRDSKTDSAFGPETPAEYEVPRTHTEQLLVGIWLAVLEIDRVGVHDNFVDLGGDSISAERCVSRIRDALQVDVPIEALFAQDTDIAMLAEYIDNACLQD